MSASSQSPTGRAAALMDMLGLSEEELCHVLDVDPLSLLSGQVESSGQLPILWDLCREAAERTRPGVLARWVRVSGPKGRPIDALLRRDFASFEDSLGELAERGFVIRAR